MIIIFSCLIGTTIIRYKRKQIDFIDDLIFMGERTLLMLRSTAPDTQVILRRLQSEERLSGYDLPKISESSSLPVNEKGRIAEFFETIGKYDIDSQIKYIEEFTGYYKMLKEQYQKYFDANKRLYIVFSMSAGMVISRLLI